MTRETGVRPPGVPTHGPPHLLHKRLTILELLRSLPINHKFSCFLWEESTHKHLLKSPSRACSAILHPIYFIKGFISGKLFRFSSLNLYNDVSDDKIHSMSLIVMSHGHWGGLGDFIISRLQSYIPFLMKMLKMSTFGKLVLIDNWNNIIYFFLDICWQGLFNGWLLFEKNMNNFLANKSEWNHFFLLKLLKRPIFRKLVPLDY